MLCWKLTYQICLKCCANVFLRRVFSPITINNSKELNLFFIKPEFHKHNPQTLCVCVCVCTCECMWGGLSWGYVSLGVYLGFNRSKLFCCSPRGKKLHSLLCFNRYSLADSAYLGILVCSQRFSFLSKVSIYNIYYGAGVLTIGSGEK